MEVLAVDGQRSQRRRGDLRDCLLRTRDSVLFCRVRRKPRLDRAVVAIPLVDQDLEHLGDTARVDTGSNDVPDRLLIRLELVVAAELREQGRSADVDRRLSNVAAADAGQHTREHDAEVGALRLLHLLDGVTAYHVADLVSEDARELTERVRALDQPTIDVEVASWNREGVYLAGVDDKELILDSALVGALGDRIPEYVDVAIDLGILDDRKLCVDLLRVLRTHLDFLLRRDSASGHRNRQQRPCDQSSHKSSLPNEIRPSIAQVPFRRRAEAKSVSLLTLARDLKRRKARERQQLFVCEGVRAVEELLRSPLTVRGALVARQLRDVPRGAELERSLREHKVELAEVSPQEFASAADTESPQGVLAVAEVPARTLDNVPREVHDRLLLLVLDAIQDPGNVGTILRTAAALGVTATVALPGTVDLWNAKVVRSAMGAHFHHLAMSCTWDQLDAFRAERNISLWATDAAGAVLDDAVTPPRLALVVGNEGSGVSDAARQRADRLVAIPIASGVDSLNVAVATGILLHELRA
jgi:TrmH family RNA methyltransferase